MKILVTGGAGYIGSHTILEIIRNTTWDIISIDNYSNSTKKTFDRIKKITGKRLKNYNTDLCNLNKTKKVFSEHEDISAIIHFAALKSVPESVANPKKYIHNNITSLKNILECARTYSIRKIIFSSSCSVYGSISQLPVDESTPLQKALSPYGFTKQEGEKIIQSFSERNPTFSFIILRYFNPIGADLSGMNGDDPKKNPGSLVGDIINTAKGIDRSFIIHGNDYKTRDGTCIRDYVHISDIAKAHFLSLKKIFSVSKGNYCMIINLGTGKGISVLEAIRSFEKINRIKLNIKIGKRRKGDIPAIYSNTKRAKNILSWRPKYNISDMMKSIWIWETNR
ncbi:MAG TPA: UDP-glucose 4-epimerase GalE [Bacteroidia bacterium]